MRLERQGFLRRESGIAQPAPQLRTERARGIVATVAVEDEPSATPAPGKADQRIQGDGRHLAPICYAARSAEASTS